MPGPTPPFAAPEVSDICLVVDAMGGDHGPDVTLPACQGFLERHPKARLILVGQPERLRQASGWARCQIVEATEVVEMDDSVEVALRKKRRSSMRVAVEQLREGADGQCLAHAAVSAGNTGALMAVSRYVLRTLPGIDRPAIAAVMPNARAGYTTMLDLGANVDSSPEQLLQYALMGSALVSAVEGQESPTVGLLNVGEEALKGGETMRLAGALLRQAHEDGRLNFLGNVEGNDIFKGTTDVVVCDGFVGNAVLKASEGLAAMLVARMKQAFQHNLLTRLAALAALPALKRFKRQVDHRQYNGAALLGLNGLVFKSHGSADAFAFGRAMDRAYEAASHGLLQRMKSRLDETPPSS